jgi:hypothetical protein
VAGCSKDLHKPGQSWHVPCSMRAPYNPYCTLWRIVVRRWFAGCRQSECWVVYGSARREALACSIKFHEEATMLQLHDGAPSYEVWVWRSRSAVSQSVVANCAAVKCRNLRVLQEARWTIFKSMKDGGCSLANVSHVYARQLGVMSSFSRVGQGIMNLRSSSKKRRPSTSSWLGNA